MFEFEGAYYPELSMEEFAELSTDACNAEDMALIWLFLTDDAYLEDLWS